MLRRELISVGAVFSALASNKEALHASVVEMFGAVIYNECMCDHNQSSSASRHKHFSTIEDISEQKGILSHPATRSSKRDSLLAVSLHLAIIRLFQHGRSTTKRIAASTSSVVPHSLEISSNSWFLAFCSCHYNSVVRLLVVLLLSLLG